MDKATFAGGCFWCMVKPFDQYDGIERIVSGYTGGHVENPTYEQVCSETTGHYEAVQITFDPDVFSYKDLVEIYFQNIDPFDSGGQFYDRGQSYQTAIFYHDDNQKEVALEVMKELETSVFHKQVAVKLLPASTFYEAEGYHQDYYKTNPAHYNRYFEGSGRKRFVDNLRRDYFEG